MKEIIWRIGDWEFYPDKSSLIGIKNQEPVVLNDTLNNILILLIESKGNVLSRDLIAEKGWKNRIVTDDSIRQAIKKLRETLDQDGVNSDSSCIMTIRGKGYKLTIETKKVDIPSEKKTTQRKSRKNKLKFILTALISLGILTSYADLKGRKVDSVKASKSTTLTFEKGGEFGFSLADNGNFSYGVSGPETSMSQKILIRDKDNNLIKEINRSSEKGYITQPVFSPSGNKLLFLDFDPDNCKISYYDLIEDSIVSAIKCSKTDGLVALDWISEDEILYSTSKSLKFPLEIVGYNLISKEYNTLTKLPVSGRGDFLARSCGNKIASIRDKNWKNHDIYLIEKDTELKLDDVKENPYSLDWTSNCENLFYTTSSGGVYFYDIENKNSIKVQIDLKKNSIIKYKNNSIYISGDRMNDTDITSLNLITGKRESVFQSAGKTSQLTKVNGGENFMFISDRTGISQVWISDAEMKNVKQITFLDKEDKVNYFQYDEERKKIYYSLSNKVFEVIDGSSDNLIYQGDSNLRKFNIHGDDILYIEYKNNHWQLVESLISNPKNKKITRGISNLKVDGIGNIYVSDDEFGIYKYENSESIISLLAFKEELSRWIVDRDGNIYLYGPNEVYIYRDKLNLEHLFTIKESIFYNIYIEDQVIYIPNMNSSDMKISKYHLNYTH